MTEKIIKPSFEEKIGVINQEIAKRRGKWKLSALSYIDYEDVSQILRLHIFEKWHLWDHSQPLERWLNKVITNRMINLVRDHYGRVAPPCNGCSHNMDDFCSFTKSGSKCAECPLYATWQKKFKVGYNIKLAESSDSENFVEQVNSSVDFSDNFDYESSSNKVHQHMKAKLPLKQYKIYELLIIQNLSEKEVAKQLKLKSSEKGREPGYRHLAEMKNKFYLMAKEILLNNDIIL